MGMSDSQPALSALVTITAQTIRCADASQGFETMIAGRRFSANWSA
jgi:hypothetical protein